MEMTMATLDTAAAPRSPQPPPNWAAGRTSRIALGTILAVAGAFTSFTGLNRALGGMRTLGWQGSTDFLQVVAEHEFLVQDSHTRFLGGVWTGVGLLMLIAAVRLNTMRPVLNFVFAIIFLGGLARFSAMRPDIVFGSDIIGSLAAELILMPLLFLWVSQAVKQQAA
jgi:hypothetical protein